MLTWFDVCYMYIGDYVVAIFIDIKIRANVDTLKMHINGKATIPIFIFPQKKSVTDCYP